MNKKFFALYFAFYLVLIELSLGVFFIFKPFTYVDNVSSYIVCNKSKLNFEIGPNFIYTFNGILDEFNDQKAKKLCEYGLIKDYADTLKTPAIQNYAFYPLYTVDSSWIDALVISFITFLAGVIMIETSAYFFIGPTVFGKRLINLFVNLIY